MNLAIDQHFSISYKNWVEGIFPLCHSKFFLLILSTATPHYLSQ